MTLGRPKGFKVSVESRARQLAWFSSPAGLVHKEKMRVLMKQKWVEQKARQKAEVEA